MADNYVSLTDIKSGLRREDVVFRLVHFWEARRPTTGNNLMGLELLLLDEQGTAIQGFIAPNRIARFQPLLKRNSIYRLTNFYATENKTMYRVTEHEFTLCFTDQTTLLELNQTANSIEEHLFKLRSFAEFEAAADQSGSLYDVIGHLKLINGQHLHERPALESPNGQKDRVNVHLQLKDGPVVNVYLWDSAASEFLTKFHASQTTPEVLLVTMVNPKRLGAYGSALYLLLGSSSTAEYLTWLGANADALAVVNTTQVTKLETVTIAELLKFLRVQPSQVVSFICEVTITEVLREAGWYYISCTGCSRKCLRGPTSFVCTNCSKENVVGILKYRVELMVQDNSGTAVFVFLDDAATPLAGRSATALMDNLTKENGDMSNGGDVPFPDCFSTSIGRTHKLAVKITDYTFRATRKTITVSKILRPEEVSQPAPPAPATENATNAEDQAVETSSTISGPAGTSTLEGPNTNKAALDDFVGDAPGTTPKRPRLDA